MNDKLKILLIAPAVICLTAFVWWRYDAAKNKHTAHGVIIRDRSGSSLNGCDCTASLADRLIALPGMGERSTLTILATGNQASMYEPVFVAKHELPQNRSVIEGRADYVQKTKKIVADVRAECERITPTEVSPVFFAIKRGIEQLRSAGCGSGANCFLFIQSDGEETIHAEIKKALSSSARGEGASPAQIDNDHIRVVFSGVAEIAATSKSAGRKAETAAKARDPRRADRLRRVWTGMFTRPELISFEPYCIETTDSAARQIDRGALRSQR